MCARALARAACLGRWDTELQVHMYACGVHMCDHVHDGGGHCVRDDAGGEYSGPQRWTKLISTFKPYLRGVYRLSERNIFSIYNLHMSRHPHASG